jgi:hypothetical protein
MTSTKHTGLSQRESLERIILNLCDHLDIKDVYKKFGARGSTFYSPGDEKGIYQSATNTILALSSQISSA